MFVIGELPMLCTEILVMFDEPRYSVLFTKYLDKVNSGVIVILTLISLYVWRPPSL